MVLSQSQFLIKGLQTTNLLGGGDGTAINHIDLSPSLSNEGTYCRGFEWSPQSAAPVSYLAISNSVDSSAWVNNFVNYAFSLRAWVRLDSDYVQGTNNTATTELGLFMGFSNFETTTLAASTLRPRFQLCLRQRDSSTGASQGTAGGSSTPYLALRHQVPVSGEDITEDATINEVALQNINFATWYRIRLDVIPTSDYFTVRAYTGIGNSGSETWTSLATINSGPGTQAGAIPSPSLGFYYACTGAWTSSDKLVKGRIDRLSALGEDLTS